MNRLSEAKIIIDFLKSKSLAETRKPLQKVPEIYQHKIPQQHNMNDCGLHLIRSFELSIIRRKFIISLMRVNFFFFFFKKKDNA
jgi:Ulp1 family protease